jgi:hypothetical protein
VRTSSGRSDPPSLYGLIRQPLAGSLFLDNLKATLFVRPALDCVPNLLLYGTFTGARLAARRDPDDSKESTS